MFFTTPREVYHAQEDNKENMEENASDPVCTYSITILTVVFFAHTAVHRDTERQEMSVTAEKKIHIDASHVVPSELIDYQVHELKALEEE